MLLRDTSLFLLCLLLMIGYSAIGQEDQKEKIMRAEITDGDTIYIYNMDTVEYYEGRNFRTRVRNRRFTRLMRDVELTMPYARLAAEKIQEIDSVMLTLTNSRDRERYLDSAESRLMDDFEDELKSLNRRQGLILIKLIDRETGETTYQLLREYRNRWAAWFWQGMARVFRMNLKTEYDPEKEEEIEMAIKVLGLDDD